MSQVLYVFRLTFEYRYPIQMPCTMVPDIGLANDLNSKQVTVHYSDAFAIQMLLVRSLLNLSFEILSRHNQKRLAFVIF